jgi:1,4-alpha-glucan branching enzyme
MYIYNVTVSIDKSVQDEWLHWMKTEHMPAVMKTGCFTDCRICRVLHVNDEGETFSMQYAFAAMPDIERYQKEFAPALQAEHSERYQNLYVAFRTLLEVL